MPNLVTHSPDNSEFARVLEIARLRDLGEFTFDIGPDEAETAALVKLMNLRALRKFGMKGKLVLGPDGVWTLRAALGATAIQTCVVTLEPVTTRIDQSVHRRFVPQKPGAASSEITLSAHDDDETEPLAPRLDLGLVAVEALALALPAYPRSDGAALARASFTAPGTAPMTDADVKPFAGLAALRDKLGGNS